MPDGPKQVLFVDDDAQFLELLRELLGQQAGDAWEIHTAGDVGQALGILAERSISLLVIDIHMPVIDGLQFLALLRQTYPNLLRVVLTGDATESYRVACLNAGAEMFLQKPVDAAGWPEIYAELNSLTKYQPEHGFRGVLRTVGLQDILQMECLGRNSSVLDIVTRSFHGQIFIQEGQIIHAQAGELAGEAAFNHLLGLRGGEFNVLPFAEPPQRTISDSWEFLIMEAARKRDEAAGNAPATTAMPENFALFPQKAPAAPAEPIASRAAPAPATATPPDGARPRIDEMLVASPHGEVLYLWQCTQPGERIRFLEFVSQRARQLAQGLPLGAFNRLEAESGTTRAVTQMQTDRTIFIHRTAVPAG